MEYLDLTLSETKEFFVNSFKQNTLVPILGSGFTRGALTRRGGIVPSGSDLKKEMIEKIISKKKIEKAELEKESFSAIAEVFQSTFPSPSENNIIDYYITNYTRVIINKPQQNRFLNNIDWPYVYTLNIDTGIEDSNPNHWEVFYPNRKFDERVINENRKRLYKIHGDVAMFCKHLNYNEMILTESQYIASLDDNEQFHELLSSDCGSKNLLYIGCSLDDEIDIKYSVLSDKSKNRKTRDIRGIYVTSSELSELKKTKLQGFNISHIVQLSSSEEYEQFYEFLVECYSESRKFNERNIDQFKYHELERLGNSKSQNLDYLANLSPINDKLPFYYVTTSRLKNINLVTDKINIIIGRRFSGKSMFAHSLLEDNPNRQRFYISEKETISEKDVIELLQEERALIIFDSNSLDDSSFINLVNHFDSSKCNIVCVILNSFDDVVNLVSFHSNMINDVFGSFMNGYLDPHDVCAINKKLDSLGIATFNQKNTLLDNTLRIANVYNRKIVDNYSITSDDELKLIIWLLIKNRIYHQELVSLGLTKNYQTIVNKFSPFVQIENCKPGELGFHSANKIICNGKLGLLQILSYYIYPPIKSGLGKNIVKIRQNHVCEALYSILLSYNKKNADYVKEFLQFDKLNDIFSRIYSKSSISCVESNGAHGKKRYGAGSLIHAVYSYDKIMHLKASDPNYWLQRAKSTFYITSYKKENVETEILEAIDWAKKAEQDSRTKVSNGETRYNRTESNAIMQVAMLYGRLAKLHKYSDKVTNESALDYYHMLFSDSNNVTATTTLLRHSRGTDDFSDFISQLIENSNCVGSEWTNEKNKLINIKLTNMSS